MRQMRIAQEKKAVEKQLAATAKRKANRSKKPKRSFEDIVRRTVDDVLFGDDTVHARDAYARDLYKEDGLFAGDAELNFPTRLKDTRTIGLVGCRLLGPTVTRWPVYSHRDVGFHRSCRENCTSWAQTSTKTNFPIPWLAGDLPARARAVL